MSPSDLKQLKSPSWLDPDRPGAPTLMLFSAVDDRSGVAYQEYRCVYGEDVEAALRFLFNAMSPSRMATCSRASRSSAKCKKAMFWLRDESSVTREVAFKL
jgi:hypothetical protein